MAPVLAIDTTDRPGVGETGRQHARYESDGFDGFESACAAGGFRLCRVMPEQEHPEQFSELVREYFKRPTYTDQPDERAGTKYRVAAE